MRWAAGTAVGPWTNSPEFAAAPTLLIACGRQRFPIELPKRRPSANRALELSNLGRAFSRNLVPAARRCSIGLEGRIDVIARTDTEDYLVGLGRFAETGHRQLTRRRSAIGNRPLIVRYLVERDPMRMPMFQWD